jgi:hypothetical protein
MGDLVDYQPLPLPATAENMTDAGEIARPRTTGPKCEAPPGGERRRFANFAHGAISARGAP